MALLGNNELKFGSLDVLAFGGAVEADTVVSRIVNRALARVENDHIVEKSSSIPALFAPKVEPTQCNHFRHFEPTPDNKAHLDKAARHVVRLLV